MVESGSGRSRRGFHVALVGLVLLTLAGIVAVMLVRRGSELNAGIAAYRAADLAGARQNLGTVLSEEPDNVTALVYMARVERQERHFQAAADLLSHAAAVAPEDPAVRRELGHLLLELGRPAAAVRQYQAAVQANPMDTAGWIGYVRALRAAGDPRAEQMFENAPAAARAVLMRPGVQGTGAMDREGGAERAAA